MRSARINGQRQEGATLVVALIFLILMSLFAISAFNSSNTNLRVVGNMQSRQESIAAAQVAIEKTLSSTEFSTNPAGVASVAIPVDIDGNGTNDYAANIAPQPRCYRADPIKSKDLNPALPADLSCMKSAAVVVSGLDTTDTSAAAGNSLCATTEWNVRSVVSDTRTSAVTAINQGVALRVLETDANNACK